LGPLPFFSVSSHASRLSKEMVKMGGIFSPMFQREALSIYFGGDGPIASNPEIKAKEWDGQYDFSENYGVRIYAGGVNVISGRQGSYEKGSTTQDFVVVPKQERLDGFCVGNGLVKQFVAMPLDKGYSVEQQLSSQEYIGGMQLEIAPRYKTSVLFARAKTSEGSVKCPNDEALDSPQDLFLTPSEAGFLPGQLLLMQPLEGDWIRHTKHLKFSLENFPEKEFFGTAPWRDNGDFHYGRPTFLRELMAWCAPDLRSGEYKLEVISPIPVPIAWGRLTSLDPPSSWDHLPCRVYPSYHGPGTATLRLSPFIDIRCITISLLRQEAEMQLVRNIPKGSYNVTHSKPFKQPESYYKPLYSLVKDETALMLMSIGPTGAPFRMAFGAGAARKQRIITSKDKQMFDWGKSQVVNIHILNSVAFAGVTGLTPPPCPISWREYANSRLPFYVDRGKGLEIVDGPLSLVRSVQEMDLASGVVWDVVIEVTRNGITGCTFCETNLADTL
jgi:hypothetical protein